MSLSIRSKIFLGFGVLLLGLVATGVFALTQLRSVDNSAERITGKLETVNALGDLRFEMRHLRAEHFEYVLEPPESRPARLEEMQEVEGVVLSSLAEVRASPGLTDAQLLELDAVEAEINNWITLTDEEVIANVDAANQDAATEAVLGGEGKAAFKVAFGSLGDMLGTVEADAIASRTDAAETVDRATTLVVVAIIVAAAVASGLALAIAAAIVVPVRKLSVVTDRLSKADIEGLNVEVSGRDEIGRLGESFKGVLAAFHELMSQTRAQPSPE
jgi:methyl-accepting chemotaxis protein